MTTYERGQSLLQLLQKQPGLLIPKMAQALDVSQGTIRSDLEALKEEGVITRLHSGAVLKIKLLLFDTSFGQRFQEPASAKLAMAREAAKLVSDGTAILLDANMTIIICAIGGEFEK